MKNSFFALFFAVFLVTSCNTGKEGCYTGNANYGNKSKLEVASSMPKISSREAAPISSELQASGDEANTPLLLSDEIQQSESAQQEEPVFLTMASVQNEGTAITAEELKTRMAAELRMVASSTENRFAGRILNRTAKKIETKDFRTKEKLTFFDKLKTKIFGKLQAKYGRGGGMSTADILAIVSLSTGVVAFAAFYASFLFGLAAIITGAIALRKGTSRRGMAIAGIVLGALAIFFWSGWFIFY
ncbi:MAG: DUF4190 domain-containing protein [Chitinophagales bacterium]|nr:DUF4190 domain-containing protein [Chitinophagales bacterium]